MKKSKAFLSTFAFLGVLATFPTGVAAQQHRGQMYHPSSNAQATSDMRSRLAAAAERVRVAEQHHKLSHSRSIVLQRQVKQAQAEMTRFAKKQGFVSAGELASYGRLVKSIDVELSANSGRRF